MIKHIVVWALKEEANGKTKEENKQIFKTMLEDLVGKVPSLKSLEVGLKTDAAPDNCDDIVLVTEFDTWEGLSEYATHPDHLKVIAFAKQVVAKRSAMDYEF